MIRVLRGAGIEAAMPRAAEIMGDVRRRGDTAVIDWAARLDGRSLTTLRVTDERLAAARLPESERSALRRLIDAVRIVSEAQRPTDVSVEAVPGVRVERRWQPIDSVGVYVPGGRHALPSSLVMGAVPARVAGVGRVVVVTPSAVDAVLVAAREAGVDEVYEIGGAQAIAALAYGTESVTRVDKIVGPGNAYVTAAKLLASTVVAIDLPAGPTELVTIADREADAELVAAGLLAQAEHGADSEAMLLTDDRVLSERVRILVDGYDNIEVRLVDDLGQALAVAEEYAPEHLELHVTDPARVVARVRNAGAVFVGTTSVVGDYGSGATHVLPTGGLARAAGGLGLEAFLRPVQVVSVTRTGAREAARIGVPLAMVEGLDAHAAALEQAVRVAEAAG